MYHVHQNVTVSIEELLLWEENLNCANTIQNLSLSLIISKNLVWLAWIDYLKCLLYFFWSQQSYTLFPGWVSVILFLESLPYGWKILIVIWTSAIKPIPITSDNVFGLWFLTNCFQTLRWTLFVLLRFASFNFGILLAKPFPVLWGGMDNI